VNVVRVTDVVEEHEHCVAQRSAGSDALGVDRRSMGRRHTRNDHDEEIPMGLLSSKNIAKAKALAEKNKEKIASSVNKATDAIDKKTGGKHTDTLKKVDGAAQKYAGTAPVASESDTDAGSEDADDSAGA